MAVHRFAIEDRSKKTLPSQRDGTGTANGAQSHTCIVQCGGIDGP